MNSEPICRRASIDRRVARRAGGFSLLELTLVIVIIGLLMGVAAISLTGRVGEARVRTTEQSLMTIRNAVETYEAERASLPPSLDALVPTYLQSVPTDAWKNEFYYRVPTDASAYEHPFYLVSNGEDKEYGTEDDLDAFDENLGQNNPGRNSPGRNND